MANAEQLKALVKSHIERDDQHFYSVAMQVAAREAKVGHGKLAEELRDMAKAVIDLGSRRRSLLFLRGDQLGHFVSCLVYLPRDRYTTAVRLEMQDILVREFGGASIDYSARVSESPWALVHFTVKMPPQ